MNKVLFPSNSPIDFAAAGGQIGWAPIVAPNSLQTMANNIIANENIKVADHAIPSPIAYVKDFRKKMANGDEDALNEWKGMLALIALRRISGKNITIQDIPLYPDAVTGQPTTFGSIICDALHENSQITGYEYDENGVPVHKTLSVFCKDGVPFAMFLPKMVICPFKEYPANLFADVNWYDVNERKWTSVRDVIQEGPELTMTSQKLYKWLDSVINTHPNMYLQTFQSEILGTCPVPDLTDPNIAPKQDMIDIVSVSWPELRNFAPPPIGTPTHQFADKLLIVIPPENHSSRSTESRRALSIGQDHLHFAPFELKENNKSYYVIPPIHKDVVDSLRKNLATLAGWRVYAEEKDGEKVFVVNFQLQYEQDRATQTFVQTYRETDIAWTESLPYISMWPFVNFTDDSWKEHFVAVFPDDGAQGRRLTDFQRFTDNVNCTHIIGERGIGQVLPVINISVVAKNDEAVIDTYDCHSNFNDKNFRMIRSTVAPYAIEFSYVHAGRTYRLGNWVINRDNPIATVDARLAGKRYHIGMDFGTTSTNVYLREVVPHNPFANLKSVSSAGKFLLDIYNPYVTEQNLGQKNKSDFIQNYYLFSARCGEMGKIFTYGQNFFVTKDGIQVGGTISNVTGRAVVVDEEYIMADDANDSGIYNGLKVRDAGAPAVLQQATDNFICNILTYAVLEAKTEGASQIEIRVSYPAVNFAATVLNGLTPIITDLSQKSGINITRGGETEARSAGEYFVQSIAGLPNAPIPTEGFAILDIGGGTSDFSYWKQVYGNPIVDMKNEQSFGYAGNYLVTKSIIQVLRDRNFFKNMWSVNETDILANAINIYNSIDIQHPIGDVRRPDFLRKASTLDFILEKCQINSGVLSAIQYNELISTVRMKYYALFYLIAHHIRENLVANGGEIDLSLYNFRLCFAGCGSKGMEICRQGVNGADFDLHVQELFGNILYGMNNTQAFGMVKPICSNKEEVVVGINLIDVLRNPLNAPAAVGGVPGGGQVAWGRQPAPAPVAANVPEAAAPAFVPPSIEQVREVYLDLLNMISYFENVQENDNHVIKKVDPRDNVEAASHFNTMFANVNMKVLSSNYDAKTYSQYFALLMLESMIDNFIGG